MRQMLFHGTNAVEAIVNSVDGHGFLPMLAGTSTGAIWGDGTYFARDARYSDEYARTLPSGDKQMMLVDVLVGLSIQGAQGDKVCPFLPGQSYARYNSLVNRVQDPSIFVVQHSNQAYLLPHRLPLDYAKGVFFALVEPRIPTQRKSGTGTGAQQTADDSKRSGQRPAAL